MNQDGMNPDGGSPGDDHTVELRQILEALFEERAAEAQLKRLDELVLGDSACRRFYLEYVDLHGNLYWDAAQANAEPLPVATPLPERRANARRANLGALVDSSDPPNRNRSRWIWAGLAVAAIAILAVLASWPMPAVRPPAPAPDQSLVSDQRGTGLEAPATGG
ncbi:MAG TPA: hypothetical protein VEI07_23135, partial [Planctomycetaceae bacterium]|nr:hypothetical protein [Planctomycetaceae bacterium]